MPFAFFKGIYAEKTTKSINDFEKFGQKD